MGRVDEINCWARKDVLIFYRVGLQGSNDKKSAIGKEVFYSLEVIVQGFCFFTKVEF